MYECVKSIRSKGHDCSKEKKPSLNSFGVVALVYTISCRMLHYQIVDKSSYRRQVAPGFVLWFEASGC